MEIFEKKSDLTKWSKKIKSSNPKSALGLVPTMGYLHQGHLSLIEDINSFCDTICVSIFVNPTQFNSEKDLENYPRDLEKDLEILRTKKVDAVFCPTIDEIYFSNSPTKNLSDLVKVKAGSMSKGFCGDFRPGHFDGVCDVVARLFLIVEPDVAIFGEKDFQQLKVIQQMANDLNFSLEIKSAPIFRDKDGLALSSRNSLLPENSRQSALTLFRAIELIHKKVKSGIVSVPDLISSAKELFLDRDDLELEYLEIINSNNLEPQQTIDDNSRVLIAAWVSGIRLIDNSKLMNKVL